MADWGSAEKERDYDAAEIDKELIASRLQQDVVCSMSCSFSLISESL